MVWGTVYPPAVAKILAIAQKEGPVSVGHSIKFVLETSTSLSFLNKAPQLIHVSFKDSSIIGAIQFSFYVFLECFGQCERGLFLGRRNGET